MNGISRIPSRATALGLAAQFTAATVATTTACGADGRTTTTKKPARAATASASPASGQALEGVEGKAYGYSPYAWTTRRPSSIGVYGIDLHDQSSTVGGTVKMVLYRDGGVPGPRRDHQHLVQQGPCVDRLLPPRIALTDRSRNT
ncbi:hypothetical protein [Streptomyces dysideae]|uniref:Uncharacterized protein n=1 Tax=Streptomyces dysideae TaxID=909626 RepID=A0A101V479_9ACTN|nr:hypothetical protein [Streptomyces dysideae]KUO22227.1 hypothetical protein AQJ91_04415 [Streptomyces dysideae]